VNEKECDWMREIESEIKRVREREIHHERERVRKRVVEWMKVKESEEESGRVKEIGSEWVRETIKNRSLVSNEQFPTALKSEKHFSLKRLLINFCFDEYNEFFNSKYLFSNETDY